MIHPVTITEASRVAPPLRKDRNPRLSVKDYFGSMRHARDNSATTRSPEGLKGSMPPSAIRSSSRHGALTSAQRAAPPSLRVHTKGALLTSGFAYHPGLFELNVHRIMWDKFTSQIVDAAKLSPAERAMVWAAAVPISPSNSYYKGRNKSQRYQEEKVKEGLLDESEGSLGDLLRQWNEGYFVERGLLAQLELCETAQEVPSPRSHTSQREARWSPSREDGRAERKFSLVITQTCEQQEPAGEIHQTCVSSYSHLSIENRTSDCAVSPLTADFKPLPNLPTAADRRLRIAIETTYVDSCPAHQLTPTTRLAELEGDHQYMPLLDQQPIACPPGAQNPLVSDTDPLVLALVEPFGRAWAVDWPLTPVTPPTEWPLTPLTSPGDWPLTPVTTPGASPLSTHPVCTLEAYHERTGHGPLRPTPARAFSSDHVQMEDHAISCHSPHLYGRASNKPVSAPNASFFMPLDLKPFSSTLDFDPQLVSQYVATAH